TWAFFTAYADGYSGYVPSNSNYIGGGVIRPVGPSAPGVVRRGDTVISNLNGLGINSETDLANTGVDAFWNSLRNSRNPRERTRGRLRDNLLSNLRYLLREAVERDSCASCINEFAGGADLVRLFGLVGGQGGF